MYLRHKRTNTQETIILLLAISDTCRKHSALHQELSTKALSSSTFPHENCGHPRLSPCQKLQNLGCEVTSEDVALLTADSVEQISGNSLKYLDCPLSPCSWTRKAIKYLDKDTTKGSKRATRKNNYRPRADQNPYFHTAIAGIEVSILCITASFMAKPKPSPGFLCNNSLDILLAQSKSTWQGFDAL